jgi:tagaturonate epimerase
MSNSISIAILPRYWTRRGAAHSFMHGYGAYPSAAEAGASVTGTGEHRTAGGLAAVPRLDVQMQSLVLEGELEIALVGSDEDRQLAVRASPASPHIGKFVGHTSGHDGAIVLVGPLSEPNAAALRDLLPWLRPRVLGLATSVGLGDRLGLATPGHVRAVRAAGGNLAPVFAQQSIREMERTQRSPQQVVDDALWGVFAQGWSAGYGADGDHLKTDADVDACLASGFTFFTFDPGRYVNDRVDILDAASLRTAVVNLPWDRLSDSPEGLVGRYVGRVVPLETGAIAFDEATTLRCAAKYGAAIAHVASLYRHLDQNADSRNVEVEVSVDETRVPTTHAEHVYIATELRRLHVHWVSLAPRYLGQFEKGVDYSGDVIAFETDFAVHAAISRELGPYKLSLHSGSDKFGIYLGAARQTDGLIHLKTAGTSYLEALRAVATVDPDLFRAIYRFACERYETDKASYSVSASLDRAPGPDDIVDGELGHLLDQHDARQILHVTFGSVLTVCDREETLLFAPRLKKTLQRSSELYASYLEAHFLAHFRAFSAASKAQRQSAASPS